MPLRSALGAVVAASFCAAFTGCTARTNVGATGAAPEDAVHLWVTIDEIALADEADTPPESETGWTRQRLSNPVVVDLANVAPETLVPLVTNMSVPAGTYRQLYLGLADPADRLVDAASKLGLDYNAQIEIRKGSGAVTKAPLELPAPGAGITIPVDLTFRDQSGLGSGDDVEDMVNLAAVLEAASDVVSYEYGSDTGYILNPVTSVVDVGKAGAVTGKVDTTALPADHPGIIVSAQVLDDTRDVHLVVRRARVADDGSFTLFPLPAPQDDTREYDIVISGAGSDTVVIRDVPVSSGDEEPTVVQSTPILLSSARTAYADVGEQSPSLPAGVRVEFYQTVPGRDQPYLIDGAALDPVSRRLPDEAFALGSGSVLVGTYADGNAISFESRTPVEGNGGYVVGTAGLYRSTTLAADAVEVTGSRSRPTVVVAPYPEVATGGVSGVLNVNIFAQSGRFDSGFISVSAGGRMMETIVVDQLLRRGGGTVRFTDLPSGGTLAPAAGVPYQVTLRAWGSSNPSGTLTLFTAGNSVVLGDTATATIALQIQ